MADKAIANLQAVCEKVQEYDQSNVQAIQKEILGGLYELRDTMDVEVKEAEKLNYRVNFMQKKMQQMFFDDTEKEALRQENAKLKYRIEFLLKYIEENIKKDV